MQRNPDVVSPMRRPVRMRTSCESQRIANTPHPPDLERLGAREEATADDEIGKLKGRGQEIRDPIRRMLTVAVALHHSVVAVFDRVAKAGAERATHPEVH